MISANYQQERMPKAESVKWFLAGLIEGEGSVCVSIKKHPKAKFGFFVDPEFFIYQNKNSKSLLELAKKVFGTGRIFPKPGNENVLVFAITERRSLLEKVVPFLKKFMILSSKRKDYDTFIEIVERMYRKEHHTPEGLASIVEKAYELNPFGKGKKRKRELQEVLGIILRGHTLKS